MHLVPGRHFPNGFVATQRLKRNLGLEIRREPAPFRHLVFRRYPVEYTLATCPTFWDHLKQPSVGSDLGTMTRRAASAKLKLEPAVKIQDRQSNTVSAYDPEIRAPSQYQAKTAPLYK